MKSFLIVPILFCLSSFAGEPKAPPKAQKDPMPRCVRPVDFSNGKFVASYAVCLKRQEIFCEGHKENKECLALPQQSGKPYYKTTTDDIEPSKRCRIEKDDSYKCLQDPIRIIVAEEEKPNRPEATPTGTAGPDLKAPTVPTGEMGGTGDEKNPPVVLPPPPPQN